MAALFLAAAHRAEGSDWNRIDELFAQRHHREAGALIRSELTGTFLTPVERARLLSALAQSIREGGGDLHEALRFSEEADRLLALQGKELTDLRLLSLRRTVGLLAVLGRDRDAATLHASVVERVIRESPGSEAEASVREVAGWLIAGVGRFVEARPDLERAIAIREELYGKETAKNVFAARALARTHEAAGNLDESMRDMERILEVLGAQGLGDSFEAARAHCDIARLLVRKVKENDARARSRECGTRLKNLGGEEHPDYEFFTTTEGHIFRFGFHADEAVEQYEKSRTLLEKAFPSSLLANRSLFDLAISYQLRGDVPRARDLIDEFLKRALQAQEPSRESQRVALLRLASLQQQVGQVSEASETYRQALVLIEEMHGKQSGEAVLALQGLASTASTLGLHQEALELAERILSVVERSAQADNRLPVARSNRATIAAAAGDPRARAWLNESVSEQEALYGKTDRRYAAALLDVADFEISAKHFSEGLERATQAFEIYSQAGPAATGARKALTLSAHALAGLGRLDEALSFARRALAHIHDNVGTENVAYGNALALVAFLETELGEAGALDRAIASLTIRTDSLKGATRYLTEEQALRFAASRTSTRSLALSLALKNRSRIGDVWHAVVDARGIVLDELASRSVALRAAEDLETQRLRQQLERARSRYSELVVIGSRGRFVDELRRSISDTTRELSMRSSAFRSEERRRSASLDEVMSALPPHTALVSLFEAWPSGENSPLGVSTALMKRKYIAFVAVPGQDLAIVDLGDASLIDSLIQERYAALRRFADDPSRGAARAVALDLSIGARLKARVLDPLMPHIGSLNLAIVPDGALALLNFASLPAGNGRYQVETGRAFHVLSSERDLLSGDEPKGRGLVAIGNPDFGRVVARTQRGDSSDASRGRRDCSAALYPQFQPLPRTQGEVARLNRLYERFGARESMVRVGKDATEEFLKGLLDPPEVLHFATHGFAVDECATARTKAKDLPDNVLRFSGLALARANEGTRDSGDGLLTADEASGLNLRGTSWVVLAACDTGRGAVVSGEGILGLRRGFQVAGARTVISSLWSVEDRVTESWMRDLYEARYARKMSTMDAVQHATRAALAKRRADGLSPHPLFWAGFVAAGDWR